MHTFTSGWLRDHGVEGDDATLANVAAHARAALEARISYALVEQLDDIERAEYLKMERQKDSHQDLLQWLKLHCPDHSQIINEVTNDFQQDIIASDHPIMFILEQTS